MIQFDFDGLWGCKWPCENAKAVICVIHGLGEHIGRYEHMAKALNAQGYTLYGYDQRGHGQTPGKRGVARLDALSEDALKLIDHAHTETGLPVVLFGHSMGGGIGLYTLVRKHPKVCCAIITSPWLRLADPPPAAMLKLVGSLPCLFKNANLNNGLAAEKLCHDPVVADAYVHDPHNHTMVGLLLAADLTRESEKTIADAANVEVPLLLMHGCDDAICSVEGSRAFAKAAGQDKCLFIEYPGMFHELHNEPEVNQGLFDREAAFIAEHLPKA